MTQAQLEALAAGNPRVAERMRAGQYAHRLGFGDNETATHQQPSTGPNQQPSAGSHQVERSDSMPAVHQPAAERPGLGDWPENATATGADMTELDGELHLILWADGADEEHPTIAIALTDGSVAELAKALKREGLSDDAAELKDDPVLLEQDASPGPCRRIEPEEIHGYDLDRTRKRERSLLGLGPETGDVVLDEHELPGRVDLEFIDAEDRSVIVRLRPGQANFIGKWLEPPDGLAALPEFAINLDGTELRHTERAEG